MKTSIMVLGIGCAATMAMVLSTDNGIPGFNLFRSGSASIADIDTGPDNSEQTDELLTPLPDHAKGLTKVLHRLHSTSVRAFESIPAPDFGGSRGPIFSLLNEGTPPKHQPDLAPRFTVQRGRTKAEQIAEEAWLWLQLMYGVTDRGFVYRSRDLQADIVHQSLDRSWDSDRYEKDWRLRVDSSLTPEQRAAPCPLVVGFPKEGQIKEVLRSKLNLRLHASKSVTTDDRIWRIRQMELVSLLKHDPAVAYKYGGPIWMGQSEKRVRPTRTLNENEVASLEALSEGKDHVLAWDTAEERLQLVGAIRAKDACLKCHEVQRGDLLGAFTYWIEEDRQTSNKTGVSQDEAK